MSGKLAILAVPLLVAHAASARAADDEDEPGAAAPAGEAPPASPSVREDAARTYPPSVDGPALRLPESPTRLYVDGTYAVADDLSALPYIEGKARNYRAALGGAWRWRRFTFEGQIPFNVTTIDVTMVLNQALAEPRDAHQTALSLGDLTLGAIWTERLTDGEGLIAGLAVRGRLATHTTHFKFHLADQSLATFTIPYYFHVEPTLVLGGAIGRFTYVMNQGAIALVGPDGYFQEQHVVVPSIYFWDAHYALALAPWRFLGASVELATTIQLNHVASTAEQDLSKFNDIRAAWVAPALQVYAGEFRVDAIGRFGLTRGQQVYGVLEYVGTHSFALRLTRWF